MRIYNTIVAQFLPYGVKTWSASASVHDDTYTGKKLGLTILM